MAFFSSCCGKAAYPGNTGTTYDNAFSVDTQNIKLPMWWYAVISISEGVTHAGNTMIGCVPDLRKMVTQVNMTKIADPELKQQLKDFEMMCYIPARTEFNQDRQKNKPHLDALNGC